MSDSRTTGSGTDEQPVGGGDPSWFEEEIVTLLPDLFGAALGLTREHANAEDLVSDAVVKAWACIHQLQDRSAFRGWMFRILTNTFISTRRAQAARPTTQPFADESDEGEDFSLFEKLHQPFLLWWANPEREFLDRLLREDLERAIAGLPETFRVVVVLADLQGFSYAEIGQALEIPVGTVRSRLARGRGLLQRALWDHARDVGLVSDPHPPSPGS